jgi:hypothetical protein
MALTLLLALAIFWVPLLLSELWLGGAVMAGIPIFLLLTTFSGANIVRIERSAVWIRRHYLGFHRTLARVPVSDIEKVSVEKHTFEKEESHPALGIMEFLFGMLAHVIRWRPIRVKEEVFDLVLHVRGGESVIAISSCDSESVEAARGTLSRRIEACPA